MNSSISYCCVVILSVLLVWGCGEAKQTKVEEGVPAVDSTKFIQQDTVASVSKTAEVQMDENVIMEIWDAYINSEYCDITGDVKKARTQIKREGFNVASLELDEANAPLDIPDDEEFLPPTVTETFACYSLNDGGCLVLWYYDASEWGRKIFAVFSYKDKQLTRLKNTFPPISQFVDSNPSFDWDELVKFNGTEVVYIRQDCWPTRFDADGFGMSEGGMEEIWYKFDGSGFAVED
ncbi:MAG: hypothetical protein J6W06_04050 [Bacteroidales bacterium]|nr:hypothetical protein [Bacteroidales bacterium]